MQTFMSQTKIFGEYQDNYSEEEWEGNELDGCYHVYLDIGSNIGKTTKHKKMVFIIRICGCRCASSKIVRTRSLSEFLGVASV